VTQTETPGRSVGARTAGLNVRSQSQPTTALLRRNHERRNAEAARIIIAAPDTFGGPEAGLVRWAWLVLRRLQPQRNLPFWGEA
jgi:hypothetical protein